MDESSIVVCWKPDVSLIEQIAGYRAAFLRPARAWTARPAAPHGGSAEGLRSPPCEQPETNRELGPSEPFAFSRESDGNSSA
jgi:hypothetical protein